MKYIRISKNLLYYLYQCLQWLSSTVLGSTSQAAMLLCIGLRMLWISSSSHSCYANRTLHDKTITQTHARYSSDGKRVKPPGPESHTSTVLVASLCCRTLSGSPPPPPPPSLSFFFFTQPIWRASPLLVWDARQEHWAICTTLSWIVLRRLVVAAVTDDRLTSFACVYPSKRAAALGGGSRQGGRGGMPPVKHKSTAGYPKIIVWRLFHFKPVRIIKHRSTGVHKNPKWLSRLHVNLTPFV